MSACCCPQWFCSCFILVNKALNSSGNWTKAAYLSWFLYCVGFSDFGVIATIVLSSLGVWGLRKHSAGFYEAVGSIIAVRAFRSLTCLMGCSFACQAKYSFLPVSPNHGSWFGLCGMARTTGLVWWSWFRLRCWNRMLPNRHSRAIWFSYFIVPFPISCPFFFLLVYFPFSYPVFSFSCFLSWSQICCIYTQIWHFWCHYLDNHSLLWCYWCSYTNAAGLYSPENPQHSPSIICGINPFFMQLPHSYLWSLTVLSFLLSVPLVSSSPVAFFHAMLSGFPCPCRPSRYLRQTLSCHAFSEVEELLWARAGFLIIQKVYKRLFPCPATEISEIKLSWHVTEDWNWTERYSNISSLQFSYFKKKPKYFVTCGLPSFLVVSKAVLSFLQREILFPR